MTGLDVTRDALIEVAVVITDADLNIVDPGIDVLITPPAEALEGMNDFVRQMPSSRFLTISDVLFPPRKRRCLQEIQWGQTRCSLKPICPW